jgi:hypothetical protein
MKTIPNALAMLAVMLMVSPAVFAQPHPSPVILAQQVAGLTSSGFTNPAPPVPAGDIVQRDAR